MRRNNTTKKVISIALTMALAFSNVSITYTKADDTSNVIEISDAAQWAKIGKDAEYPLDGNYILTSDIENVTETIGQGDNTLPDVFTGTIDGDGHSVTLDINAQKTYQGLIGQTKDATIKNLVVKGSVASTLGFDAGIVAKAVNTTITNCGNEATVNVTNKNAKNIAGITGYSENTTITNSYNAGDITGGARVSGITGEIKTYTAIENCYNTGSVTTKATRTIYSGGLVGYGYGTTSNVSTVKKCYTTGVVTEKTQNGAVMGYINAYVSFEKCYYLEGINSNVYGFKISDADEPDVTKLSSDELKGITSDLGEAFATDSSLNNGYPVLKWQIKAANTDVEDKATLDALVNELPSGVISPKFNTDKNINTYLSKLIESKEAYANKGIKVSIKNVENRFSDGATYIDEDGTIHYFYINLFDTGYAYRYMGQADVTFNLTLNNVTVEYAPRCVNFYWDLDKVKKDLEAVRDEYIDNQILDKNEDLQSVTENLMLPANPNVSHNGLDKNVKWVKVKYTSSDSSVISISNSAEWDSDFTNMYYTAKVNRKSEDQNVVITAEFTFDRYNSGEDQVTETIKREIPVKVLAYNEVLEQTKALQKKVDTYKDNLSNFTTGGDIDLSNVKDDIQLVIPKKLGLDGKYYEFKVESSDTSVMEIYGYRTYTYRPLPGEDKKTITLTVTITNKENTDISASTKFDVTVIPLTEEEITNAVNFMNSAKENFFEFIKNENSDANNITGDLKVFYGIYQDENGNVYSSNYVSKPDNNGIIARIVNPEEEIPDHQRYWISSDKNIIDDETLRVTTPVYNTKVTVGAVISHEIYENYAKRYADDPVYGKIFAQLANQKVLVELNVIGEKGEEPTTAEPTTEKPSETATTSKVTPTSKAGDGKYKKLVVKKFKAKKAKKSIKLSWQKNKKATGYQIKYWTSKNSKHAKVKLLKKNTIVKSTIKGVNKGKKYIIIIRTYNVVNGKKIYGKWSKKTLKIK